MLSFPRAARGQVSYRALHAFPHPGANPASRRIQASDGDLYGTTSPCGRPPYAGLNQATEPTGPPTQRRENMTVAASVVLARAALPSAGSAATRAARAIE